MQRIVLAYSGGPASSIAIPWLRERHGAEVATVTVDLGQSEPLDGIRVRALGSGAARAHVLDRRDVFARHHVLPAVQAGAMDIDSDDAMATLARPLIAHALVEIAQIEGVTVVAHAAVDAAEVAEIDAAVNALAPEMQVLHVTHGWAPGSPEMVEYARVRGIPLLMPAEPAEPRVRAAAAPLLIRLDFRNGVPLKINGVEMDLVELMTSLDTIAAAQGTAGGTVLGAAYRALQQRAGAAAVTGAETVRIERGICEVVPHVQ